ncbi:MAG: phosphoribosylglycinamide formyltransferase [Gemmatimonadota bacterium]
MSMRVAVFISGRGSNLAALIGALRERPDATVALVVSNRPDAGGVEVARREGIPTAVLQSSAEPAEWLALLDQWRVDFVVLAGFLKQVPSRVVQRFAGRIINIHPALLPKYGGPGMYGLHVHRAVLAGGDAESGATVHLVTERYDEGPVLGQARVPVLPGDTPESLAQRVLAAEHRLLPAAVLAAAPSGTAVPFVLTDAKPAPFAQRPTPNATHP